VTNTSNFDYSIEMSIDAVRQIFHLAVKNEPECFPHNIGPLTRDLGDGLTASITVAVLDDESRPADLSFADEKHLRLDLPNDITIEIPAAPDPALSRITLSCTARFPGRLDSWNDDQGEPWLGVRFDDATAAGVEVLGLTGVPVIGTDQIAAALHARYQALPHRYTTTTPGGPAELLLYDGTLDTALVPPTPGNPPITVTLDNAGGTEYLNVVAPIHVDVPTGAGFDYVSFGRLTFWRPVTRTETSVTVDMDGEPTGPARTTLVTLDNGGPGHDQVVAALRAPAINAINGFGALSAPAYSPAAAVSRIQAEIASYVHDLRFGLYTPRSNQPGVVLSTPVGFLLPASGTLAVLMNRRTGTPADDTAPDDFRGASDVALAVGRENIIERSDAVIASAFPGVNGGGGHELHRPQGDATLYTCHATPESDGGHDQHPGHLWVTGECEVHIDCWPDPDVTFNGPVFVDATPHPDDPGGCWLELRPHAGDFDVGESCCDVLLDILIPIVGWIMLAVVENLIDRIGGQLAQDTADAQTQMVSPLPKVVVGIAQVECCLDTIVITDQGFVFPGSLHIRRAGRSFEDLSGPNRAPRPDQP
jgi:hypothetical protein